MPVRTRLSFRVIYRSIVLTVAALFLAIAAPAKTSFAASDWKLDPASSTLTYQSVKKNTIVETNQIRNLTGSVSADGDAKIEIDLNSVDTGVDIRNVRMRFLFFETFKFPTATITAKVDPAAYADLPGKRRMTAKLPFRLDLHGMQKDYEAEIVVTMITDSTVSIASKAPIAVNVADFGLLPNVEKLQQAANVSSILPTASVSFDFIFSSEDIAPVTVAALPNAPTEAVTVTPISVAAGPVTTDATKDAYSDEECQNRFEVLSRTGSIYFRSGSARLDPSSKPVLDTVVDAVTKCLKFKVEVSAYTDSDGTDQENLVLSQRRAKSVATFIREAGVPEGRIVSEGFGEGRPVAANDSDKNKALNRRIEFSAAALEN